MSDPRDLALLIADPSPVEPLGWRIVTESPYAAPDDHSYLRPAERENPDIRANIEAMTYVNARIRWFAEHEDGMYLGYWLGEAGRSVADSPVVQLDNEGQYRLAGRTCAEAFALVDDDDDPTVRGWFATRGVIVPPADDCWARVQGFESPEAVHRRVYKEIRAKL